MRKTTNYGLALYDKEDKMSITAEENSLNANMELIDKTLKEKADNNNIPTKLSELDNDKNFITNEELENKGYLTDVPSEYITETELNDKGYLTEHQDLSDYAKTTDIPTKVSELENDSNYLNSIPLEYVTETDLTGKGYATESFVTNKIAEAELSGSDVDLSGLATKDELNGKVDKVKGKSLIDDTEIERLKNVTNYDDTEIRNELNDKANTSAIPTKVSQLENDKNYLTSVPSEYVTETELNNKKYLTSVPSDYKTKTENDSLYQPKGNYLTSYTESDPTVPSHVKSIKTTDISNWNSKSTFSGNYNDLTNKPTIPTVPSNISAFNNDKGYLTSVPSDYKTKTENDSLYQAKGSYLTSIPSEYVTETELSGKNYATKTQIPTKTSQLTNDSGYLTEVELTQEQLDEIAEEVASAMSYVEPKTIPYTVTKSCVQASTGKIGSTSDHMRTDYITLTGYDTIKYVGKCANSKMAIGFFDANQQPMLSEGVVGHGTATKEVIKTIPQGAVYAICSAYVGSNTSTEWVVDVYYSKSNPTAEAIEGLKSSVYSFEGKKVMFFGDSITYDGNMYRNNLIEKTKMVEVACFALNGATMRNHSDTVMDGNPVALQHSNTIPNQVQKLLNTSTSYETPDIVIISAATNDGSAEASYDETQYTDENYNYIDVDTVNLKTFSGAMRWAYEKIISLYPNTKIFFATPIQCGAGSSRTFASLKTKAECIRQNCERLSTPCIDAFRKSGIYGRYDVSGANGKYLKDGLHPNSAGAVVLAKCYHKELANALID